MSNMSTSSSITAFRVVFILWGILGFLVASLSIFGMLSSASVGVGTSAFIAAGMLYWIGGMVFFGVGDLLQKVSRQPSPIKVS
jgi:steroid 5-alpha reductase family enzyme